MEFKIGDLVTRKSHNNDLLFKIKSIDKDICILEGVNIRLVADCLIKDLIIADNSEDDTNFLKRIEPKKIDRDDYFYLPGKILHIDSDEDYLNRCMDFYKKSGILANGILESENNISFKIINYLNNYRPDILVITGHDAFNKHMDKLDINAYKNSSYYVNSIKSI